MCIYSALYVLVTKRGKKHIIRGSHYNSGQKDLVFANGLSQAISDPNCVSLTTGTTFPRLCLFVQVAEYLVTFFFSARTDPFHNCLMLDHCCSWISKTLREKVWQEIHLSRKKFPFEKVWASQLEGGGISSTIVIISFAIFCHRCHHRHY